MTWIQTYTGRAFDLTDPKKEQIDIVDIAHALSHLCRFGGHTNTFYSVAEHSVRVAQLVPDEHKVTALLHDATEAYYGDVTSPLKRLLPNYKVLERAAQKVIAERFRDVVFPFPACVLHADMTLLATEARDLMGGHSARKWKARAEPLQHRIYALSSDAAKQAFLAFYREHSTESVST